MDLTPGLLRRAKLENLERLARYLGIDLSEKAKLKPARWWLRLIQLVDDKLNPKATSPVTKVEAPPSVVDVLRDDIEKGRAA